MREMTKLFLAVIAALALAGPVACGGGGDDDDVDANGGGDGGGTADAPVGQPDSGGTPDSGGGALLGLGQVCYGGDCSTGNATSCAALASGAEHGFCTASCGTTDTTDSPPADGNTICAAEFQGTTPAQGTPACALYQGSGPYEWSCAVLCGTSGSTDLGGCPDGLVCGADMANYCS
jgi:hypothetical protein